MLHSFLTNTNSSTSSGIYCDDNINQNRIISSNDLLTDEQLNLLKRQVSLLRHASYAQTSPVVPEQINNCQAYNNQNILITAPSTPLIHKKKLIDSNNDDTDLDVSENLSNIDLASLKENQTCNNEHFKSNKKVGKQLKNSHIKVFICKPNSYEKRISSKKSNLKHILRNNKYCEFNNQKKFFSLIKNDFNKNSRLIVNFF